MQAGVLQEVIKILSPQVITTEYGDQHTEYVLKTTTRAKVNYQSGNRSEINHEIFYDMSRTFTVRLYVNVTEEDHLVYNNREYRIINITPDRQYQQKTILAELINE